MTQVDRLVPPALSRMSIVRAFSIEPKRLGRCVQSREEHVPTPIGADVLPNERDRRTSIALSARYKRDEQCAPYSSAHLPALTRHTIVCILGKSSQARLVGSAGGSGSAVKAQVEVCHAVKLMGPSAHLFEALWSLQELAGMIGVLHDLLNGLSTWKGSKLIHTVCQDVKDRKWGELQYEIALVSKMKRMVFSTFGARGSRNHAIRKRQVKIP